MSVRPSSSKTSRWAASRWDSPGSTPPPGSSQKSDRGSGLMPRVTDASLTCSIRTRSASMSRTRAVGRNVGGVGSVTVSGYGDRRGDQVVEAGDGEGSDDGGRLGMRTQVELECALVAHPGPAKDAHVGGRGEGGPVGRGGYDVAGVDEGVRAEAASGGGDQVEAAGERGGQ